MNGPTATPTWRTLLVTKLDDIQRAVHELKVDVEILKAKDKWSSRWNGVVGGGVVSLIIGVVLLWMKNVT